MDLPIPGQLWVLSVPGYDPVRMFITEAGDYLHYKANGADFDSPAYCWVDWWMWGFLRRVS